MGTAEDFLRERGVGEMPLWKQESKRWTSLSMSLSLLLLLLLFVVCCLLLFVVCCLLFVVVAVEDTHTERDTRDHFT